MMFETIGVIVQFLPVIFILFVANLAQKLREEEQPYLALAALAYAMVAVIHAALALLGVMALLGPLSLGTQMEEIVPVQSWAWLGWGMLLPSLAGLALLAKPVRRQVARLTNLDADNPLHAVSGSMSMFIPVYLSVTLGIGLDNLSMELAARAEKTGQPPVTIGFLWAQTALFLLIALIGVGWLTRLSLRKALDRLNIVKPSGREIVIAIGWAFAMVPTVMLLEAGARAVGLGIDADVETLTEQLIGPLFQSPWGIISIGLAAGIGEEALFRGAMQPRFGLIVTSLLFALVHSNYGITLATVVVFLLGMMLGWLRIRYNTSTAMIAHAVYNSTLALIAVTAAQFLNNQ
ncbi:MAG: CPBP family intramembrane metalloprotease [Caldilinea sp.]|nr:CPBP family intramembrane metalloprotease [Caldilinea sp.]MDW8440511.1 type II CAAX endopeptidase family protein [Caldilineaceae bacterium]